MAIPRQQIIAFIRCALSGAMLTLIVAVSAYAQGTAGVSTGQGLSMGATDPYWHYIIGQVDYNSPGALLDVGGPAVVDTLFGWSGDHNTRDFPWQLRSRTPGLNVNNGWLHPIQSAWDATPVGPATMRTFVDLTNHNLKITQIAGTVWADGPLLSVYVNGRELDNVITSKALDQTAIDEGRKQGYTFSISQADGLEPGVNVLDFVWNHFGPTHWLVIRVDFNSIFRETPDR